MPSGTGNQFTPGQTAQFDILNLQPNWIVTFEMLDAASSSGTTFSAGGIEVSFELLPPPNDYEPFEAVWVWRTNVCGRESMIIKAPSWNGQRTITIAQTYINGILTKFVSTGDFSTCVIADVTPPPFGDVTVQIENGNGGVEIGKVAWTHTEADDEKCPPVNCTDNGTPCIGRVRIVSDVSTAITGYASSQEGELHYYNKACGANCSLCDYDRIGYVRWSGLGGINGLWPAALIDSNFDPVDPVLRAQVEAMPKDCEWWSIVSGWGWRFYDPIFAATKSTLLIRQEWTNCDFGGPFFNDSGELIENINLTLSLCSGGVPDLETFYSVSDMANPWTPSFVPTGCNHDLVSESLSNVDPVTRTGTWYCSFPYVLCEQSWQYYDFDDATVDYPTRSYSRTKRLHGHCPCNGSMSPGCQNENQIQDETQNFSYSGARMIQSKTYADFDLP